MITPPTEYELTAIIWCACFATLAVLRYFYLTMIKPFQHGKNLSKTEAKIPENIERVLDERYWENSERPTVDGFNTTDK
jgi:hypothetical protein